MSSENRKIYLKKQPWQQARDLFLGLFRETFPLPEEICPTEEALGRITAADIYAVHASPHSTASAMDGVAVKSGLTVGAGLSSPKRLTEGEAFRFVDTGSPLPDGFDAVIRIEEVHQVDETTIEIHAAVPPWNDVRKAGEDIRENDLLLSADRMIRPYDIGVLLAGGVVSLPVRRKPVFGIHPTGSELVEPGSRLKPGDIVEFNSRMVKALIDDWGGEGRRYPVAADDPDLLRKVIGAIPGTCDAAILIAGSSAGRRDFTHRIIEELGEIVVHGVNLMPGKPVVLGRIGTTPIIGLPGYPVSAAVIMDSFVMPLLRTMLGVPPLQRPTIRARLTKDIYSKLGMEEIIRVTIVHDKEQALVSPLPRGAGVLTSLQRADGILRIPTDFEGFEAGRDVEVELIREPWRSTA